MLPSFHAAQCSTVYRTEQFIASARAHGVDDAEQDAVVLLVAYNGNVGKVEFQRCGYIWRSMPWRDSLHVHYIEDQKKRFYIIALDNNDGPKNPRWKKLLSKLFDKLIIAGLVEGAKRGLQAIGILRNANERDILRDIFSFAQLLSRETDPAEPFVEYGVTPTDSDVRLRAIPGLVVCSGAGWTDTSIFGGTMLVISFDFERSEGWEVAVAKAEFPSSSRLGTAKRLTAVAAACLATVSANASANTALGMWAWPASLPVTTAALTVASACANLDVQSFITASDNSVATKLTKGGNRPVSARLVSTSANFDLGNTAAMTAQATAPASHPVTTATLTVASTRASFETLGNTGAMTAQSTTLASHPVTTATLTAGSTRAGFEALGNTGAMTDQSTAPANHPLTAATQTVASTRASFEALGNTGAMTAQSTAPASHPVTVAAQTVASTRVGFEALGNMVAANVRSADVLAEPAGHPVTTAALTFASTCLSLDARGRLVVATNVNTTAEVWTWSADHPVGTAALTVANTGADFGAIDEAWNNTGAINVNTGVWVWASKPVTAAAQLVLAGVDASALANNLITGKQEIHSPFEIL